MKRMLMLMLVVALTGCATIRSVGEYLNDNEVVTKMAIAHALQDHPIWKPKAIQLANGALLTVKSGDIVTIGNLQDFVANQIYIKGMLPEDQELITEIVAKVQSNMLGDTKTISSPLTVNDKLKALEFFTWLKSVAERT